MAKGMSDWAKIERSREIRLWVTQIGIPAIVLAGYILTNDQAKSWCENQIAKIKNKFSRNKTYEK